MTDPTVYPSILSADTERTATGLAAENDHVEVIRSEERLSVTTVGAPYRRVRIGKRIVTETRTVSVEVRREELVCNDVAFTDPATSPDAAATRPVAVEMILHEEQIVVDRVVVPVERVRVIVERIDAAVDVTAPASHEELELTDGAPRNAL